MQYRMIMENLKIYFGGNIMGKNNPLFERMTDSLNEALHDAKADMKTLKRTKSIIWKTSNLKSM